jgi:phosphate starvation-inducible PhoH-like protein
MKHKAKPTRKDKEQDSFTRGVKKLPKPQWLEQYGYHDFELTDTQNTLRNKILDNDLVICEGVAGTGKTAATLYSFIREYISDSTKKIVVVRTPVEVGSDQVGFLSGGLEDKTLVHFESTKLLLTQLLNTGKVETDLGHRLKFTIPNYLLGTTLDNTLLCVDECQMLQPLILKLILERVGMNSKVVLLGDSSQLYSSSKDRNALRDVIPRFFKDVQGEKVPKFPSIAYHKFEVDDVQRSEFVKNVIRAYGT